VSKLFDNKFVQGLLFILFCILVLFLSEIESNNRLKNILLNGVVTDAEITEIYLTKRGYKAIYWFYDKKLNKCIIDDKRLDGKEEGNVIVGDRYLVYYISGKDNQIFLDSPLIRIRDERIYLDEIFYKNDTIISSICYE